eukprot:gene15006-1710_t
MAEWAQWSGLARGMPPLVRRPAPDDPSHARPPAPDPDAAERAAAACPPPPSAGGRGAAQGMAGCVSDASVSERGELTEVTHRRRRRAR